MNDLRTKDGTELFRLVWDTAEFLTPGSGYYIDAVGWWSGI